MKLLSIIMPTIMATVVMSASAFADHAVDNAAATARAAYRAADDAELLASLANREAGWNRETLANPEALLVENNVDPQDHRHDSMRAVAQTANRLHFSLSNLYRSARNAGGGFEPEDHRGDRIREDFASARADFQRLNYAYRSISPYSYNRQIDNVYRNMQRSFASLEWSVSGRNLE